MRMGGVSVWRGGGGSGARCPPAPTNVLIMECAVVMAVSVRMTSQVSAYYGHTC